MGGAGDATDAQRAFLHELVDARLLIPSGVAGVYGRGAVLEAVLTGVERLVTAAARAADDPEVMRFPPLLPRRQLEDSGYLRSFPHLLGTVFAFDGDGGAADEQEALAARHDDWSRFQRMTDLVLTPAACYPVYPAVAARGALAAGGLTVDAGAAYVFRREPSDDPARMQVFHQRELVRLGEAEVVAGWRDAWRERALALLGELGLEARLEVASDPFFGRGGRLLAANQRRQELKFEIEVALGGEQPTAVASFNYHQEHFAERHGIALAGGGVAHTACLGFGLERVSLALLAAHGLDPRRWPAPLRERILEPA